MARTPPRPRSAGLELPRACGGSVEALVLPALGTRRPSPGDLEALETLLDRDERGDT